MRCGPPTEDHDLAAVLTLELLFRTEVDFVMSTARRCGLSEADAEDVTQQVFMTLQRRLHTLESPESVRPWLWIVTRRRAFACRGKSAHRAEEGATDAIWEIEDEAPAAEELLLRAERRRELWQLLETIEDSRRLVLIMRVLDEATMPEIAMALGIPLSTAYHRLRLARDELMAAAERRQRADERGLHLRAWQSALRVRDPFERVYGQPALTEAARDRRWRRLVEELARQHGSIEAAERGGLRVLSPIWMGRGAARPYPRLKRPPRSLKAELVPLPPPPATGSRTP